MIPGSAEEHQSAANERLWAAEARAKAAEVDRDDLKIWVENMKRYVEKKKRKHLEVQATLEECRQRMLANGLEVPGLIRPDEVWFF